MSRLHVPIERFRQLYHNGVPNPMQPDLVLALQPGMAELREGAMHEVQPHEEAEFAQGAEGVVFAGCAPSIGQSG